MKRIKLDFSKVENFNDFHRLFANEFDFPSHYGENMDAWIDFVEDYVVDGLTLLEVNNTENLKENNQEVVSAFLECAAFINYRSLEKGFEPSLMISMN